MTPVLGSAPRLGKAMSNLLDVAMEQFGGKEHQYESLSLPRCGFVNASTLEHPISVKDFITDVCRRPDGLKTCTLAFDVHWNIPEFGNVARLGEIIQSNRLDELPDAIRLKKQLPPNSKVGLIVHNLEDGTMHVLKIICFSEKIAIQQAIQLCGGECHGPAFRPGPWALRKAVQSLIDRIPGYHVSWASVSSKPAGLKRSESSQWSPETAELLAGVAFINQKAPECDAENQQYVWILTQIRADSGSPIAGWPETKVRIMAQNKARGQAGATSAKFFPFSTRSLKPFLADFLIPILYPLLLNFGVLTLGWPGVGKTPMLIVMGLALSRYHILTKGIDGVKPAWRRAKSLDIFRHRVGLVHEALILDDPQVDNLPMADIKSWLTSEEDQNCTGRYNDVKMVRNNMRAIASNNLDADREPEDDDSRRCITSDEFFELARKFFQGHQKTDVLATLKRSVVLIFGKHALYLRLPDQDPEAIIHRIKTDDIHLDAFLPRDKPYYAKYKIGLEELLPTFAADIALEQEHLQQSMAKMVAVNHPSEYIKTANKLIGDKVSGFARLPQAFWDQPVSSESDHEPVQPVIPGIPLTTATAAASGARKRLGTFVFPPPARRVTSKSSPAPSSSSAAINPDQQETLVQENDEDPEEEAARFLDA